MMGASEDNSKTVWGEAQAAELFGRGEKLIQQHNYARAIKAFENYLRRQDPDGARFLQGMMLLAIAYQDQGQSEQARSLAESLQDSTHPQIQAWVGPFLASLIPPPPIPEISNDGMASSDSVDEIELLPSFQPKSLESFRDFSRQQLSTYLIRLEKERKSTLRKILISSAMVVAGVALALIISLPIVSVLFELSEVRNSPALGPTVTTLRDPMDLIEPTPTPTPSPMATPELEPYQLSWEDGSLFILICVWVVILFLGVSAWVLLYSTYLELYGKEFKHQVIEKIMAFIDPNSKFKYSHRLLGSDTSAALEASTLFGEYIHSVHEDDCVIGNIGETSVIFSEVLAEDEPKDSGLDQLLTSNDRVYTRHDASFLLSFVIFSSFVKLFFGFPFIVKCVAQGRRLDFDSFWEGTVFRTTFFKGLFFRANFNKRFKQKTVVLPEGNFADAVTNRVNALSQRHGQAVKLEDPEFRRLFQVYGDDQVEARYVLSTSLMDRLVTLRKKLNRPLWVAFVGNQIYIAIRYREDLFEPRLYSRMNRLAPAQEYFETFQAMLEIVDDLNLNRRIWAE